MFVLIGVGYNVVQHRIGEAFEQDDFEERVALFDTSEAAEQYAESFRLARPQRQSFSSPQIFRGSSLMSNYVSYRIEDDTPEVLPHNPAPRA